MPTTTRVDIVSGTDLGELLEITLPRPKDHGDLLLLENKAMYYGFVCEAFRGASLWRVTAIYDCGAFIPQYFKGGFRMYKRNGDNLYQEQNGTPAAETIHRFMLGMSVDKYDVPLDYPAQYPFMSAFGRLFPPMNNSMFGNMSSFSRFNPTHPVVLPVHEALTLSMPVLSMSPEIFRHMHPSQVATILPLIYPITEGSNVLDNVFNRSLSFNCSFSISSNAFMIDKDRFSSNAHMRSEDYSHLIGGYGPSNWRAAQKEVHSSVTAPRVGRVEMRKGEQYNMGPQGTPSLIDYERMLREPRFLEEIDHILRNTESTDDTVVPNYTLGRIDFAPNSPEQTGRFNDYTYISRRNASDGSWIPVNTNTTISPGGGGGVGGSRGFSRDLNELDVAEVLRGIIAARRAIEDRSPQDEKKVAKDERAKESGDNPVNAGSRKEISEEDIL